MHKALDSITDSRDIRESEEENAPMAADFIYLRCVNVRIRRRNTVNHAIHFLWRSTRKKEKKQENSGGSVGGRWKQIVFYEHHSQILSFKASG